MTNHGRYVRCILSLTAVAFLTAEVPRAKALGIPGVVEISYDPAKPLNAPEVRVGPVTAKGPSLGIPPKPPTVTVSGTGEIAKAANGAAAIMQASQWPVATGAELAVNAIDRGLRSFFNDPFNAKKWLGTKVDETRLWLDGVIKQAFIWFLLGLAAIVLAAVLISSLVTGAVLRRRLTTRKRARRLVLQYG